MRVLQLETAEYWLVVIYTAVQYKYRRHLGYDFLPTPAASMSVVNRPDHAVKCTMKTTIRWMGPDTMRFVAQTGSGHLVTMDGAPEGGGENLAPRPMEVVLAGTGGCTAYDVVVILRKNGQDIRGCEVRLEADRAESDPKVFTRISFHFVVRGRALKANLVERAIKLSHDKYCSASAMLSHTAKLETSWEIVEDA